LQLHRSVALSRRDASIERAVPLVAAVWRRLSLLVGAFLAPTRRSEPFWHRRDGRSLLAPTRRSEPFWHRRDGRSLSGTDGTVGAFLAPTRRSERVWHRRYGRSLSGTDETVGAFLAPTVRSEPFWHRRDGRSLSGTDETFFGQFGDMWTFWFCTPDLCARTYVGISYGRIGHASCPLQSVHRHFCDV
jgi:hypothetical protein